MSFPIPKIGDINVRGYVLAPGIGWQIEALQSLYGNQPPNATNALLWNVMPGETLPPEGSEIYFDIVAAPASWRFNAPANGVAVNVRLA